MSFLLSAFRHREMIRVLALRDFQSRYAGTVAGSLWTVAHPIAIVTVFYFVFSIGFKSKAPDNVPFILWFAVGLMAWFYFNDGLQAIANSITGNPHLVKKTVFPVEVLAVVQIVSALLPHLAFLAVVTVVLLFNEIPLEAFRLQVFYFMLCTTVLLLGLGWLISALQVFYRDISQALTIILNLWFWATPIVWDSKMMPPEYNWIFVFNPMHYVVDGYRGMLIYAQPKWPDSTETMIFWTITLGMLALGSVVFRRLKPEFADVL
ncbi:ABC transporter permease [Herbaspirillum seropedicae]|uniref:ABC transporter permease n=1 Tax=Herbaspirillum seropedicae TaxID=964 RepID=UPI000847F85C|nr:ABC transporter permease [Herbaspirillum seropedicae]MDR6395713.1 lipopolysaccharide transport system permease protein/teichoic acid transport system permease protein [Herbaspirillum seropedicae]